MRTSWFVGIAAIALLLSGTPAAHAQSGRIIGTVVDAESNGPIANVQITVQGTGLGAVSGQRGTYSIGNVPAGSQTLVFDILGYETLRRDVTVAAGQIASADAALSSGFVEMGTITVIGASQTPTRIVEAPAAVSVVSPEKLQREGGHGQLPKLFADQPGVDVVQSGVQDFNINARGYNSSLNRRVLVLQDGIDRSVGFLQAQEWTSLSMPLDDLGKLEMVRGPGSALYGANAFSGVVNITTPDPLSIAGTKLAISGGQRETGRVDVRHAGGTGDGRVGFKGNVGYSSVGETWSVSRTPSDAEGACPAVGQPCTFEYGPLNAEAVPLLDDPVRSVYGSARVDYNFDSGALWTVEGGTTHTENEIFVTGIGRVQVNGTHRPWARTQYASDRWTAMAWYSGRRAGEEEGNPSPFGFGRVCAPRDECTGNNQTSLASGALLLESSDLFHVELQSNWKSPDNALVAVGGVSNRWTSVDTQETLMEEKQDDTITSAFGQLEYQIHPQLRALVSGRFDHFTVIDDSRFSPKAALVFTPRENHALRATFNQAFQTPNYSELYLRAGAGSVPLHLIEQGIEAAIAQQIGMPIDLPLNFQPTPVFARGNDDLEVEKLTGYEIGYKGTAANGRFYTTVDVYYNEIEDFVTDLLPGVNPDFPTGTIDDLVPAIFDAGPLAPFKPGIIGGIQQALGPSGLLPGLTFVNGMPQFVLSYTNAGQVTERGVELGVTFLPAPNWEVFANYTRFDFDIDDTTTTQGGQVDADELQPNTPEHKANVGITYSDPESFSLGVKARTQSDMDWAAGVFAGEVEGYTTVDLSGGWRATEYARLHLVWTNVLDKEVYQLYGGSVIGSRAIGGVTFNF
ncbi:MAG TPA: TonB-dependent receptor [Gemmatimonadota bacterium]|nr:TonB-dependent receptor [Gemmatimonadota bacterium]